MTADVIDYIEYQIHAAPIRPIPFPHLVIQDILPPDFYSSMIDRRPKADEFDDKEFGRGTGTERHRTIIRLNESCDALPDRLRAWWRDNMGWFTGGGLASIMLERFGFVELAEDPGRLSLVLRDGPGYALGPHTDVASKIVTLVMYTPWEAPTRITEASLGTSIYAPKDAAPPAGGKHYPVEMFRRMFTVPYRANTALLFLRGEHSFHGVEPALAHRETMQYQVVDKNSTFARSRAVT